MKKDFLVMTRRERHGMIAVLVLIALLLTATVVVRSCRGHEPVEAVTVDMEQFEAEVDSASATVVTPAQKDRKAPADKPRRPSRRKADKKPKPAPEPRRIDPVPQF